MLKTPLAILTLVSFLVTGIVGPMPAYAQDYRLPAPGVMVRLSLPLDPPILKGIKIHPDNPFRFDFILDQGDSPSPMGGKNSSVIASEAKQSQQEQLKQEATKLIKYFLASLTIPEKDLWVNLSPYEKDRIIPNSFGLTEMGRDLLAEDYMLKQITASLIYPEDETGKKFWKRIYEEAQKRYGTTNIPVNTFNKVWIVPEKAVVFENAKAGTAYVVESKLKVMLEQDYLSLEKHEGIQSRQAQTKNTNQLGSQVVREIVIPELTKEVNEDKNFARLRQVYNSLILATWYKKKIKDSVLAQVYDDKDKIAGINISDPQEKEKIYQRYLKAFKKGVFNFIKEDVDPVTQETIPRKYFSGGMDMAMTVSNYGLKAAFETIQDPAQIPQGNLPNHVVLVEAGAEPSDHSLQVIPQRNDQTLVGVERFVDINGKSNIRLVQRNSGGLSDLDIFGLNIAQSITPFDIASIGFIEHWGAGNNILNIPRNLAIRMWNHPAAQGRNQAEKFRNALANPVIDTAVGAANGLVDPARGVIALRPGADRFVALHEAVEGIIRARLAMRHDVNPNDPIAMAEFFRENPELGEIAHQRAEKIEQKARMRHVDEKMNKEGSVILTKKIVQEDKEVPQKIFDLERISRDNLKDNLNLKEIVPILDLNPKEIIFKENIIRPFMFAPQPSPLFWIELNYFYRNFQDDYQSERDKELAIWGKEHSLHPAVNLLPPGLKALVNLYDIRIEQVNDQAWDEHWLKFMKHKDLEAIPDGAEVPEARLVLVPRILNNGDLQHFIYLVGHEIGHILDEQRFVAEFLANEDDVTIQQVLSIGIFQRYGIGIEGVNISAFRNGLENVERNGIAQEILVTSIGMWLADPQKYEISYPLAHQFFMEIFPEITKVLNKTKSTQMTTVPNHWGAHSGKTEDNAQLSRISDVAMNKGGIDLTPANMNFQVQNSDGEIKFHLDPTQLAQLQNAPGFVPVIISIQPLKSLPEFLGLNQSQTSASLVSSS